MLVTGNMMDQVVRLDDLVDCVSGPVCLVQQSGINCVQHKQLTHITWLNSCLKPNFFLLPKSLYIQTVFSAPLGEYYSLFSQFIMSSCKLLSIYLNYLPLTTHIQDSPIGLRTMNVRRSERDTMPTTWSSASTTTSRCTCNSIHEVNDKIQHASKHTNIHVILPIRALIWIKILLNSTKCHNFASLQFCSIVWIVSESTLPTIDHVSWCLHFSLKNSSTFSQ